MGLRPETLREKPPFDTPTGKEDRYMRRYSETSPPPEAIYWRNYARGIAAGLTLDTAKKYATLTWWGEHYGIKTPSIVSGRRSERQQAVMRARWDRGDRAGLVARPAKDSKHTTGEAFDLTGGPELYRLGQLAAHAGLLWGGNFTDPDPVHFQAAAG